MRVLPLLSLLLMPTLAQAGGLNGADLSLAWGIPFAMILLSIATGPLFFAHIWHQHFGKITAVWTLLFLIPFVLTFDLNTGIHVIAHALVGEYIPFILLLLALYTISGGILVEGSLPPSPKLNTTILAIGTVCASLMGTTGAAMLLIRPLLRANENRRYKVHNVIFFIFLVANIGGGLTPLGDPPLFLGFLKGVGFGWTLLHMFIPVFISSLILLVLFFIIDSALFKKEQLTPQPCSTKELTLLGKGNFFLLGGVVLAVLFSGMWKPQHAGFNILGTPYELQNAVRDVILVILTLTSLFITPKSVRAGNEFNFDPILEVGKLFMGIFITISPVLAILKAGKNGAFSGLMEIVHTNAGEPINSAYFWATGILSGFLDNAPTYLVFFNMAGGNASQLTTGHLSHTLLAISMGSVFMGALSYIGNAPNFMVKAIAEQRKVQMPTFFGYMMWSFGILIPLFALQTLIFFVWEIF